MIIKRTHRFCEKPNPYGGFAIAKRRHQPAEVAADCLSANPPYRVNPPYSVTKYTLSRSVEAGSLASRVLEMLPADDAHLLLADLVHRISNILPNGRNVDMSISSRSMFF